MFSNIIGQENVIKLIKSDIKKKSLNRSMLFHGHQFVGKLSAAFELVRVLNCLKQGDNDCSCECCNRIRALNFEGLIFLSRRDFSCQLHEYILSYNKNKDKKYLNSIYRIIKLVSLPLQDFLVNDSLSENDKKDFFNLLEKSSSIIMNESVNSSELEDLEDIVQKIQDKYKSLNIPINVIRNMLDWTYISQPDINRVIIIDHVDYLEKASQNVLLKRLEEPSDNLFFILIAQNKNQIVKTIISRCRSYYFNKLSKASTDIIVENNFGESKDFKSVKNFLYRNNETSHENVFPILVKLLNLVFLKEAPFSDLSIFLGAYKDRKYVKAMLYELGALLQKEILLRQTGIMEESDLKMLESVSDMDISLLNSLIKEKYNQIGKFGLNSVLLLEGIFYPLKAMVLNDQI